MLGSHQARNQRGAIAHPEIFTNVCNKLHHFTPLRKYQLVVALVYIMGVGRIFSRWGQKWFIVLPT